MNGHDREQADQREHHARTRSTSAVREPSPRPVANSGASASGANLAAPASAISAPRAGGDESASSAYTTQHRDQRVVAVVISGNSVYGKLTQPYASASPSSRPSRPRRSRIPSRNSPSTVSASNTIAAARAAGSS